MHINFDFDRNSASTRVMYRGFNFVMQFRVVFTKRFSRLQNFFKIISQKCASPKVIHT